MKMMGSASIRISLIWITAFIIAPSHSQEIPKIKNLDCVNDFHTKMVCFWEVENENTNCSSDFQLKYTDFEDKISYCEDLDNEYDGNFRVPSKCICNITRDVITADDSFLIEVESHGQSVFNTTIDIFSSVKPKAPSNLQVNLTDPEYGVSHWKSNNEGSILDTRLTFHIQFISKENSKPELESFIEQLKPQYTFSKRQLTRGHEYRVRVRAKHDGQTKEIWSEWSPEAEFRNDYDLTVMETVWFIIPGVCVIVIVFIVSCYFCIIRTKKRWWNNIPDPARSKLAESNLIPKNHPKPAGKPTARKSCGNWLSQLVKAHKKSKHEQFTKEHPVMENNMRTILFEPEKVDIESIIQMYPREDDKGYQDDSPGKEEDDFHLMTTDMSIEGMFRDILCDSSMKEEALEQRNVGETFGSSILRDHFHKTERHLPLSMVSQESGYQSYDSDDSPGDFKSDGTNVLYFDHPLSKGDFLPYAPTSSINKSVSQIEDALVNTGYNSFANALAEAASDIMERDNISIFSLDTVICKPSNYHSPQNPKSILYYNRRCFPHVDDLHQPIITPTSDHTIDICPPSVSQVPGYQSFNQAVEQGDTSISTMSIVFDSGYKPFECPTNISTNSLDNIGGLSELPIPCAYQDPENHEDLPKSGMVNGWTNPWNETQSSDFNLTEFNFFDSKYPFYTGDEHRGCLNQASDIHYGIDTTFTKADNSLALTFDISDHMRNFANMHDPKTPLGLEFFGLPTKLISFSCSLEETPIIIEDLQEKKCLHSDKDFPMKFENKSYFVPLHHSRARGYSKTKSHLLVKQNSIDEEGNLYMKITLR